VVGVSPNLVFWLASDFGVGESCVVLGVASCLCCFENWCNWVDEVGNKILGVHRQI
jgi:hypothetical protein